MTLREEFDHLKPTLNFLRGLSRDELLWLISEFMPIVELVRHRPATPPAPVAQPQADDSLTVKQVAPMLGVSTDTIYRRKEKRYRGLWRYEGGSVVFSRAAVQQYIVAKCKSV